MKTVSINEGADEKLNTTNASQRGTLLRGTEGAWITARRNNWCYFLNKLIAIGLASTVAVITLYLKLTAMKFIKAHEVMDGANGDEGETNASFNRVTTFHMQQIFWLMFIYQAMFAIDQTNEMVSQMMTLDKGALSPFFELNTMCGLGLTGYITYFIVAMKHLKFGGEKKTAQDIKFNKQYVLMRNWIYAQFVWFIICFCLMCPIYGVFYGINKKVTRRISATSN